MSSPRPELAPFQSRQKSRLITRRRYPEEWAWWDASGWQMMVEDGEPGFAHLHSVFFRGGWTLWGATATPADTASPEAVRRFLTQALYMHLHPRKSRKAFDATGQVCTDAELAAFIRGQQRKTGSR